MYEEVYQKRRRCAPLFFLDIHEKPDGGGAARVNSISLIATNVLLLLPLLNQMYTLRPKAYSAVSSVENNRYIMFGRYWLKAGFQENWSSMHSFRVSSFVAWNDSIISQTASSDTKPTITLEPETCEAHLSTWLARTRRALFSFNPIFSLDRRQRQVFKLCSVFVNVALEAIDRVCFCDRNELLDRLACHLTALAQSVTSGVWPNLYLGVNIGLTFTGQKVYHSTGLDEKITMVPELLRSGTALINGLMHQKPKPDVWTNDLTSEATRWPTTKIWVRCVWWQPTRSFFANL